MYDISTLEGVSFAVMNCHYVRFPLRRFLDTAQALGFRQIELFGAMPHFYLDDVDDAQARAVRSACEERGLSIVNFCPAQGAYPMNLAIDEPQIRRRTVQMLRKGLRLARLLGCRSMLVSPGYGYYDQDKEISWAHSRASLGELAKEAEDQQVTILLEPLTPPTANLINTSAQAARMLSEVGSPFVKSMMDLGVMTYMGETVEDYFRNLGEGLRYIHFTDGPGAHVAPGDGSFPMDRHLEDIVRLGYRGPLSFEINDKRYLLDPDQAMAQTARWLTQRGWQGAPRRETNPL